MPDNKELNQRDVFSYIDHQMRKSEGGAEIGISQRTRSNFRLAFLMDLIAVFIAFAGFYAVYNIFQEKAYNLVGAEGSIRGLEDVLYQELQKKASAELTEKEQEIARIQSQLANVSASMEEYKVEQQQIMQRELEARRQQLQSELQANMQNASAEERARLQREYEQQVTSEQQRIQQRLESEANARIQQMQAEQQRLQSLQQQSQSQASSLQGQLTAAQNEMQRQLEAERSRSQAALRQVELELEAKEKSERYQYQINALFQGAIGDYNRNRLDGARQKLQGVLSLYANKPADVYISPQDEAVDRFFVQAISDYLVLKEQAATAQAVPTLDPQTAASMEALRSLGNFASELSRGTYNGNPSQANQRVETLRRQLPEVFSFYEAYDTFRVAVDDSQAANLLSTANSQYNNGNYKQAIDSYISILKDYPDVSSRPTVLNNLASAMIAVASPAPQSLDINRINSEAAPVYNSAKDSYNNGLYTQALASFQNVIIKYPNSKYVESSLDFIKKIYQTQIDQAQAEAKRAAELAAQNAGNANLNTMKAEQTSSSKSLYDQAKAAQGSGDYDTAVAKFAQLVTSYPMSDYVADSIQRMRNIMDLRVQNANQETQAANQRAQTAIQQAQTANQQAQAAMQQAQQAAQQAQANAGRVDMTALKAEHTEKSKVLFDQAKAAQGSGDYDTAVAKFSELITRYPLSDYVENSVQRMRTIMDLRVQSASQQSQNANQSSASRVDLTAMINEQTANSQSLYEQAKAAQLARSYDTAVARYSELIKKYPLSQYVGDSLSRLVNMMTQQVQDANQRVVAAYRSTNGLVNMTSVASLQTEKAKPLFDEAKNAMTAQDYDTALSKFIELIRKYPLSSYVQNSLSSINTIVTLRVQAAVRQATAQTNRQSIEQIIEQRNQIGVDLNVLGDRQTADSKNLYYQAKSYQSAGNYDTALTLYYELITKFPLSDYVKYSLEKIQEIIKLREQDILAKAEARYTNQLEQTQVPQTAIYLEKISARVTGSLGNEILMDVAAGESLQVGDKLAIYRRVDAVTIVKIGNAVVTEVSSIMSKAKLQAGSQTVRSGDLVFRE